MTTGLAVQSGNTTFISGIASGIDTAALVEIAVSQVTQEADLIDIDIAQNSAEAAAFGQLQTLAQNVESALTNLTEPDQLLGDGTNAFTARTGFLNTSDGTDPTLLVGITVQDNAQLGSFELEILQTAEVNRVTGVPITNGDTAQGLTGSFNIGLAGGTSVQIDVGAGDTIQDIAAAINAQSETSNVTASVVQISETDFQLVITGTETAVDIETSFVGGDNILQTLGVTDGAGTFTNVIQAAQEAILEIDGIQVTRASNEIDNLVEGIELNVQNAAPGTIISTTIQNDVQGVGAEIENFISAFNELRDFILQNQEVSADGQVSPDAVLFADSILSTLDLAVSNLISGSFQNGEVTSLRDIGINLDLSNRLVIADPALFDSALLNNLDEVQNFFQSTNVASSPDIAILSSNVSGGSQGFTLDIAVDGAGNITSAGVGGDTSLFDISGTLITGAAGGPFEGLTLSFQGGASTSIDINLNQGFADTLSNTLFGFTDVLSGTIQQQILALETQNIDLATEAAEIRANGEEVREREIFRFAQLEAQLQSSQLLLDQLTALFASDDD